MPYLSKHGKNKTIKKYILILLKSTPRAAKIFIFANQKQSIKIINHEKVAFIPKVYQYRKIHKFVGLDF